MIKIGIRSESYFSIDEYEHGFNKMKSHGYD